MASRTTVKSYFETGDVPTQSHFASLIDSLAHVTEDDIVVSEDTAASPIGSLTVTGYITVTLSSGATLKLAVVE